MKLLHRFKKQLLYIGIALVLIVPTAAVTDEYFEISKNLDIFVTLFKELNTYYVDPTDPGKLMRKAIDEMLKTLDPYTDYISESEIEDYRFTITGAYGGIGSQIGIRDNEIIITDPYENSPAEKSDLRPGDVILEIDGINMLGKSTSDASKLLKGQPKTKLKIKIKRDGEGEMVKEVEREEIKVKNVPYYGMINEKVAYIKLRDFRSDAGNDVAKALKELNEKNPSIKGVILDLRGNPGGLLIEAVNVVNVFTPKNQLVVSTKGKVKEWEKEYKTMQIPVDENIQVVVLTNRGSASASEIVSGTIQDLDRGIVVGQRSFGKGLVQSTRTLSYNTQLKVTTAKYYTPSGRCIQALDYSHRNEDGSVGEIADSLKKAFKTKNGRKVFDGGGITPDIKVEEVKYSAVTQSLMAKQLIFDFASKYYKEHKTIAEPKNFKITEKDFEDFVSSVSAKSIDYKTKTEKQLEELKKKAEEEKYFESIKEEYEKLKTELYNNKKSDVLKYKEEIKILIEREIVKRYYHDRGTYENSWDDDPDILQAIKAINDDALYNKLLKP